MEAVYELVQPAEGETFHWISLEEDRFPFLWHRHPEAELTLICSGAGRRFVGDHMAEYEGTELVFIGGGLPHTWQAEAHDSGVKQSAEVVQFLWEAIIPTARPVPPELRGLERLREAGARGLWYRQPVVDRFADRLMALREVAPRKRFVALLEVLVDLAEEEGMPLCSPGYRLPEEGRSDRVVSSICRWVLAEPSKRWTLTELGQRVGMSPSSLSRHFRRVTGSTVSHFILETRIGQVCRGLIETDEKIGILAEQAGFANLSHFNRQFLSRRGMSPRAYRAVRR